MKFRKSLRVFLYLAIVLGSLALLVPAVSRIYLTPLAVKKAEELLGTNIELQGAELRLLRTGVVLRGLKVYHPLRKKETFLEASRVVVRLRFIPMLFGRMGDFSVGIMRPRFIYAVEPSGDWELRRQIPLFRRGPGEDEGRLPVNVERILIRDGRVEYRDGTTGKTTVLSKLNARVSRVRLATRKDPLPSKFDLDFRIDDEAKLRMKGRADFLSPKASFDADLELKDFPLPPFSPYYQSSDIPVRVTHGFLDLKSEATCRKDQLKAPAHVTIRRLQVEPKRDSLKGQLAEAVVGNIKDKRGNMNLDFVIQGNIRNPQFRLTTNLSEAFTRGFTKGLVENLPEAMKKVGEGAKKVGAGVKKGAKSGIDKLKGLFDR